MAKCNWQEDTRIIYPTGTYHVMINQLKKGESFKKKTPHLEWKAEILSPDAHRGRTLTDFTSLTDAAMWRVKNMVMACGVDISKLETMETDSPAFNSVVRSCLSRKVFWYVEEKTTDDGKIVNNVTEYRADPDQEVIEPVTDNDIPWEDNA